ncbi:cell division protein FtsZ [Variibacter gotjawalensis]|uniref:Cell division protein FtsZ n=1 Tax=Variibacter gotjawalensis TaxID=1333996 RepID=A0A0S3PTQ2_9BRAD|nr:cell division protein FtsZ [Variibacter gotjawalensis]NIK49638.1 cell division protein FtsZ [Variibacter gotjawalensis]RZS45650.1 cell division protein FtsZ [Variibacter gotjawalensis]BAT59321.1 cell division protein FtsZ [Variibacter gotjawalensis]
MTINLTMPDIRELRPRITVFGVGGAGGNAVNNMISAGLQGVDFVVANTDAQALTLTKAERMIQMGVQVTEGLGAGSQPDVGRAAAEEVIDEIRDHLSGAHMVFVTAGMGGGTGTGAAPVIAQAAKEMGILTVGVVTKPFHFEGARRMRTAEAGISSLQSAVDTLLIIPNQNLFRVANEKTTFADAFAMADQVLYSGVACITDLMVKEGLINLDFADVRAVMREMGKAMMGTGEASGEKRALRSAEAAISNPLIDDVSMKGARGLLVSITGGRDLTLYEVDEAATRIREEVDSDANIIVGATFDESLEGIIRVSVVATGIDLAIQAAQQQAAAAQVVEQVQQRVIRPVAQAPRLPERKIETIQQPAAAAPIPHADPAIEFAPVEHHQPTQLHEDVTIRPLEIKAAPAMESHEHAPTAFEPPQRAFIPPAAERPVVRPRMPRIDELPPQAQAQIRAHRDQVPQEKPRMGLLQRLAQVGLSGLREPQAESAPQAAQPVQRTAEPVAPMPQRAAETRLPEQVAHYAPRPVAQRPAHQGLDHHGRAPAQQAASEDDQLEIPAFLRRQVK